MVQRIAVTTPFIHTDLLLSSSGVVKLADFCLGRIFDGNNGGSLSHQVATRQYRAPELLFASRHYTLAVDMWSVGVVMAELATLQVSLIYSIYFLNQFLRVSMHLQ